ncbi:hypothetical protein [Acidobacterium sp. S8]|uniref:hypothetical protein n=1 Tax=Acidobacterium sp. S8 TaxID=1641854 RepID=UPI00131A827C|nr:hypothetical protein [Acidobacterium sp. S8]
MPPYANLEEFVRQVRLANPKFKKSDSASSSLHDIVTALQQENPDKKAIRASIDAMPKDKQKKYSEAIKYLKGDYLDSQPKGGVQVMPSIPVNQPALRTVTAQQKAPSGAAPVIAGGTIYDEDGPFHGWTEIDNVNRIAAFSRPQTSAFSKVQVAHVTQILRSVQQAVDLSLNTLRSTPVLPGNGLPPSPNPVDPKTTAFIELFGPCTTVTLKTVTNNFAAMQQELFGSRGRNVTGLAVLNESATNHDMAATYRRSIFRPASGHILLIVGSGFFKTAIRELFQANDNTIGTLVHEFSHACMDTSDIPRPVYLQANQGLDAAGMPPPSGTKQCVVGEQDRQLVAWIFGLPWVGSGAAPPAVTNQQKIDYADYPLRNADAYGQYALGVMVNHLQEQAQKGVTRLV